MQPAPAASTSSPLRRPRHDSTSSHPSFANPASKRPRFMASASPAVGGGKLAVMNSSMTRTPSAFQPSSGAKKLVIKNLKTSSSDAAARQARAQQYYERALRDIENALDAVLSGSKPPVPFETLYRGVEDLCRKDEAEKVYRILRSRMETHVNRVMLQRIERSGSGSDVQTARSLLAEWVNWNTQMTLIRSTFCYLDRTHLLRERAETINDMTISQFRRMAFPSKDTAYLQSVGKRSTAALGQLIDLDRKGKLDRAGESSDLKVLKGSIRMFNILGVYVNHFEPLFLSASLPFFKDFADSQAESNLKSYIQSTERLLTKEHSRCLEFNIDSATEKLLMDSAHEILIDDYTNKLVDRQSLDQLLSGKDVGTMSSLYDLLKLSTIEDRLRDPWAAYIQDTCASIIRDKDKSEEIVLRMLDLRRSLQLMIRDAFKSDEKFTWNMREAFSKTMNDSNVASVWKIGTSKIGELLAKHIDHLMRGGLKSIPAHLLSDAKDRAAAEKEGVSSTADEDAELDRQLDQALELFRFIEGKDTFEAFYKKDLARRLLMGRSASHDAERNMLTKLRGECGANFTHNLETMFKDQQLAKEEMEGYKDWINTSQDRRSPIDLHVMVLSSAAWPTYPDVALNLPDEVATQLERYTRFYNLKHQGRKLTWKHYLAHCSIKAKFAKGTKELVVSAFQAVVLLLFNYSAAEEFLSYEQISKSSGLKGGDLDRTLQSLACGKVRVLTKHPKGRDVNPTDTFTFNRTFWDPKFRIRINQIQQKETKEENKATLDRVAQDRRFETQAAIVRIMKSRKTMSHPELQAEVINMTKKRGSVEPAQIKKEIESLIDKDYLEREGNSYTYLA